jgi:hypothetical protein
VYLPMRQVAAQPDFCYFRFLAIRTRWCSRHSLHTQPRTYAAVVPC